MQGVDPRPLGVDPLAQRVDSPAMGVDSSLEPVDPPAESIDPRAELAAKCAQILVEAREPGLDPAREIVEPLIGPGGSRFGHGHQSVVA